jgi:hypothetical protein
MQNVNLDSDNLILARDAKNTNHQSAESWYGDYGAHVSTEGCGDVCVQAVDYEWLDDDKTTDDYRSEALAELAAPSIGDFAKCDDLPCDLADAVKRGDVEDLQSLIDYFRADDNDALPGLKDACEALADDIEECLPRVCEINNWSEQADSHGGYAAAKVKEDRVSMTWDEIEGLVDLAKRTREAADSVCGQLEEAVECYEAGDLDGCVEALRSARNEETDHGDDPATSELANKLIVEQTLGIDSTGTWTPHQYAIDAGWSYEAIEATADSGVSDEDEECMTDEQSAALLAYCQETVAVKLAEKEN